MRLWVWISDSVTELLQNDVFSFSKRLTIVWSFPKKGCPSTTHMDFLENKHPEYTSPSKFIMTLGPPLDNHFTITLTDQN